ncbi:MAG: HlyD family type I secretion periplasmic adaptor subunit [Pseudomonadota bacterium]|nr:HlyD family type I secretion periplasmic adaptor subunit [Pseudomonadota bacterium]
MVYHQEDIAYMPDTLAAEVERLPVLSHAVLWLTLIVIVTGITWANIATVDEVAHAEGRVISSSQLQVIQNLEGGILQQVMVREGARVQEGQTLMLLDDTRFASTFNEGRIATLALSAQIARLEAELEDRPFTPPPDFPIEHLDIIDRERQLFFARQQEKNSAIDILNQRLMQQTQSLAELQAEEQKLKRNTDLAQRELEMTSPLVATGAVSEVELLRIQAAVNESEGQLEVTRTTIPRAQAIISEAEDTIVERRQQFVREAQTELNQAKTALARMSISNVALEDRVERTDVRSPVDGTVKQILVNTVGAVVQPGMDLVEIVPLNDTLLVEAKVRPADVAFIHPGQTATVKLTAYDFSIYGGLDAVLELISADTITDDTGEYYFQIHVRTHKNYLGNETNPMPIIPGMIATVDIITGEKTIMDYILKPLKRAQEAALSER